MNIHTTVYVNGTPRGMKWTTCGVLHGDLDLNQRTRIRGSTEEEGGQFRWMERVCAKVSRIIYLVSTVYMILSLWHN